MTPSAKSPTERPEQSRLVPDRSGFDRYLEDTIVVDWQTPEVLAQARACASELGETATEINRIAALFDFVRDETRDALHSETNVVACSASQVLRERTGLVFARCHLLVALLRACGIPGGFGYQRLEGDGQITQLHGFVVVWETTCGAWVNLDPFGETADEEDSRPAWRDGLMRSADGPRETTYPTIWARPARQVVDLLEEAPSMVVLRGHLPDSLVV